MINADGVFNGYNKSASDAKNATQRLIEEYRHAFDALQVAPDNAVAQKRLQELREEIEALPEDVKIQFGIQTEGLDSGIASVEETIADYRQLLAEYNTAMSSGNLQLQQKIGQELVGIESKLKAGLKDIPVETNLDVDNLRAQLSDENFELQISSNELSGVVEAVRTGVMSIGEAVDTVAAKQMGDLGAAETNSALSSTLQWMNNINAVTFTPKTQVVYRKFINQDDEAVAEGTNSAEGGNTLVGELGRELVVSDGRYYTVGDYGAEFVNLKKGDIVFNHIETERLLRGERGVRGHALAEGNAMAGNVGFEGARPPGSVTNSKKKSSYKADVSVKLDSTDLEESMQEELDKLKEELEKILGNFEHEIFMADRHGAEIDEIISVYRRMQDTVHEYADKYRAKGLDVNSDYIQELQRQWWEYEDQISDAVSKHYDKIVNEFENAIELNNRWMENAFEDGDLVAAERYSNTMVGYYKDLQNTIHEEAEKFRELGYSDTSEEVSTLSNLWWEYADKIEEVKKRVVDNLIDMVKEASDAVDEIQNVFDTLKTAADEYEENGGFISVDTFQSLAELGPQYMQYLTDENGMLVINRQRIQDVIAAKTEQLAVETALNYVERIRLATEEGSVEKLSDLLHATAETTNATWGLVYANLALVRTSGKIDDSQYEAALKNIDAWYSLAQNVKNGIDITMDDSIEKMRDGVGSILEYVMDMLAHRLEEQVEALEDLKDDFSDIIDLKKESLELTEKENDYQDEVAEKIEEIADLQDRINRLDLDDSREAQSEKAKLYEEMEKLQEELADTQSDYALDVQKDSLDKMEEAYELEKDREIEILEETASSYEKRYRQAIKYIEDNWDTLYDELIDWNTEYGDVLNSEITSAWDSCLAAAQKYGSYLEALKALESSVGSAGSSDTVSSKVDRPTPTNDDEVRARITEMYRNSGLWHDEGTDQQWLVKRNEELAEELSAYGIPTYKKSDGVWYVNGVPLYKVYEDYIEYHHTGGVAGKNANLKQNEVLTVLEEGEMILDKKKEKSLFGLIDFASVLSKKLGVALNNTDLSSMFRNPGLAFESARSVSNIAPVAKHEYNVTFGDTYIYGSNDETVSKHKEVSRNFVNEVLDKLNLRR